MDDRFRQEYLCVPNRDRELELYVSAWLAYYSAADKVDDCLPYPFVDRRRVNMAVKAGFSAMDDVLMKASSHRPKGDDPKWRQAKRIALDEHERGTRRQ